MANHVLMLTWPTSEARDANTPDEQLEKFEQIRRLAGLARVDVESLLWTMGRFDAVLTVEGNQERVAAFARALSRLGGIRTETLAGFDAATGARIGENAARIIGGDDLGPPDGD
jgi:uncharacterized protein with GYD domain